MAKKLRQKLSEMDGILVLAEAPYKMSVESEFAQKNLHKELSDLQQTFSLLRAEKQEGAALDMPVALLINKWDRYSEIDYAHPEKEHQKLEELLNSRQSPHKTVYNGLKSSVTEGNFQIFPVSALGPNEFVQLENGDRVERPKQTNPLNTFGLEDPFIWLVQRHNAIDVGNYLDKGIKNKRCQATGKELLNRFPPNSEEAKQIKHVKWECGKAVFKRVIRTAVIIVALVLFGETSWDAVKYRNFKVTVENPHATNKELDQAEHWLTRYIAAPYFRHRISQLVLLGREKAKTLLVDLQAYREKFLWEAVQIALKENLQAAAKQAKEYLQYYQYGTYAQEAHNIILRAEIKLLGQANEDAFRKIDLLVPDPVNWKDGDKLNQLLEQLHRVPYPQAETDDMRDKRIALEKKISWQIVQLGIKDGEEKFRKTYEKAMRAGHFLVAARLLTTSDQPQTLLNELKGKFKQEVISELQQLVKKDLRDDRSESAEERLRAYDKFPLELQTNEGRKQVKALQYQVNERQDQDLYNGVRRYLDPDHIERYLHDAPLLSMKPEVLEYQAYLDKIDPTATLKNLKLNVDKIVWETSKADGNNNEVRVYLNGKLVIYRKELKSRFNQATYIGTSSLFSAKPNDRMTIMITVIEVDFWGNDDNGKGTLIKTVSQLASGYTTLSLKLGRLTTGTVHLKIEGYPEAPTLPTWHSNR